MNIVFVADIHIKLGQKNVPKEWQKDRVRKLANELVMLRGGALIIGGDLLDVAKPSMEEVSLMLEFLDICAQHYEKIYLIPGNHEMVNKKADCFMPMREQLQKHYNCLLITELKTVRFSDNFSIDFIPYNIIHTFKAEDRKSDYAVTHVRGEIPPHVKPEIDLSVFSEYKEVYAGDLHSHQNSQGNIKYPGSPYFTSFHRSHSNNTNGVLVIDITTHSSNWVGLQLPRLLRKTVSSPEEIVATEYDHTIYEIEGDLHEMSKISKTDLLDKKIVKDTFTPAKLNMQDTSIEEELVMYLTDVKKLQGKVQQLLSRYKEVESED